MASSIRQVFVSDPAPSNQGDIGGATFVAVSSTGIQAGNAIWCVCCIANVTSAFNVITGVKDSVNGATNGAGGTAWNGVVLNAHPTVNDALSMGSFYFNNTQTIPAGDKGAVSSGSTTTLNDTTKSWTTNQWAGFPVVDLSAAGATAIVSSNTATQLVFPAGTLNPTNGHRYAVGGWILISVSAFDDFNAACVVEVQGVSSSAFIAQNQQNQSITGSGTNNVSSGAMALGSSPCIALGFSIASENLTSIPAAGTGWTSQQTMWNWNTGHANARLIFQNFSNPGSVAAQFSSSTTDFYQTMGIGFADVPPVPAPTLLGQICM